MKSRAVLMLMALTFLLASGTASAWWNYSYPTKQLMYVNGNCQIGIPYVANSTGINLCGVNSQITWLTGCTNDTYLYSLNSSGTCSYAVVDSTDTTQQNMTNESAIVASYGNVFKGLTGLSEAWGLNGNANGRKDAINGTITNAAYNSSCKFAGCYDFNGVNTSIVMPDSASLKPTSPFSVSVWASKRSNVSNAVIVGKVNEANTAGYMIYDNVDKFYFFVYGLSTVNIGGVGKAADNSWHHYVGVYNGSAIEIWQDGVKTGSVAETGTPATDTTQFYVGKYKISGGAYWNGSIDEVRFWNRSLSAAEIAAEYNAGTLSTLGSSTGLYYDFYVQNSETSAFIQNFTLDFTNGTSTATRTATNYNVTEIFPASTIPTGSVNITVSSTGLAETTFTRHINMSSSANFTLSVQPAGITLYVYDETTRVKPAEPILTTITNGVTTNYTPVGNKYVTGSIDWSAACDRNITSSNTYTAPLVAGTYTTYFTCSVPIQNANINLSVYVLFGNSGSGSSVLSVSAYNTNTQTYTFIQNYTTNGTKIISLDNSNGYYNGLLMLNTTTTMLVGPVTTASIIIYELYPTYLDFPASISYGSYPLGSPDTMTVDDSTYNNLYASRKYYPTLDQYTRTTLNAYLPKYSDTVVNQPIRVQNSYGSPMSGVIVSAQRDWDTGTYATVDEDESDSSGIANFNLISGVTYRIAFTVGGITTYNTISADGLARDFTTNQTWNINFTDLYDDILFHIEPSSPTIEKYSNDTSLNTNFTFSLNSYNSHLSMYGMNVLCNGTTSMYESNQTTSASGGTLASVQNVVNCANVTLSYYFSKMGYSLASFSKVYYITLHQFYGMDYAIEQLKAQTTQGQRTMMMIVVMVITGAVLSAFGADSAIAGELVLGAVFAYKEILDQNTFVLIMFVSLAVLSIRRRWL